MPPRPRYAAVVEGCLAQLRFQRLWIHIRILEEAATMSHPLRNPKDTYTGSKNYTGHGVGNQNPDREVNEPWAKSPCINPVSLSLGTRYSHYVLLREGVLTMAHRGPFPEAPNSPN